MASTYIGVNNLAKKVKKMYIGVGDTAKKVKKVYAGVDGIAKQIFSGGHNSTWIPKTWTGQYKPTAGSNIWIYNDNIYNIGYSVLNKETSEWETIDGNYYDNKGSYIWTDGDEIYFSYYRRTSSVTTKIHRKLNKLQSTKDYLYWDDVTWNGVPTDFNGIHVWHDLDGYTCYSGSSSGDNRVFNKNNSTWVNAFWTKNLGPGKYVWNDGENVYYSNSSEQYVLNKQSQTNWTWDNKTWNGYARMDGSMIWTDGENIYYSNGPIQYVLDKSTSTWTQKTWKGLTNFSGSQIWTDGENIYYTNGSDQYVLT